MDECFEILRLGVRDSYGCGLIFLRLGLVILTFWRLLFLRLGVRDSYVWEIVIVTFGG